MNISMFKVPIMAWLLTVLGIVKNSLIGYKNVVVVILVGMVLVVGLWNNELFAESENSKMRILLFKDGMPIWVEREIPSPPQTRTRSKTADELIAETLEQMLLPQLEVPTETELSSGISGLFPADSQLDEVNVVDGRASIYLILPAQYLENLDVDSMDFLADVFIKFVDNIQGLKSISPLAKPVDGKEYLPLHDFLPPYSPIIQKHEGTGAYKSPLKTRAGQRHAKGHPQFNGALSGASIFLSPGHGWYQFSTVPIEWKLQHDPSKGIVEDHSNAEAVFQNLVQYLWNAGARVYPTRERDMNTNMVIVDNTNETHYSETGSWITFDNTFTGGEEPAKLPVAYNNSVRYATTVTGESTATAIFTPNIPETGYYAVYIWYPTSLSDLHSISTDTKITINHTGDSTIWIQNQNRDGNTWKYSGTYYFNAGTNTETGSVVISNSSNSAGNVVIADAVRFGGGTVTRGPETNSTTHPRWEEGGAAHSTFMGKTVNLSRRIRPMPEYAAWEHESWEEGTSIYVSWHTNASKGTGTESYAYSPTINGKFTGVVGSVELRNAIHDELINDIHAEWDENWEDRGEKTSWYGELNPTHNNEMPSTIIEIGFHDHVDDAKAIKDPNFRRLVARAVYQGIVKFYANHVTGFSESPDSIKYTLLPEPPTNFRVVNDGSGSVTLSWKKPPFDTPNDKGHSLRGDEAKDYRVYRSSNGKGFDNGIDTDGKTEYTYPNLAPEEVHYFRVTATNKGGESFPTETLAVWVMDSNSRTSKKTNGIAPMLIVNGFDRIDGSANIMENTAGKPVSNGTVARGYLDRMNSYDYVISHAKAIRNHGYYHFDSCSNEAVIDGQVDLNRYEVVVWILGEESTVDHTFGESEQTFVKKFLEGGGNLFVSGSEIGFDLGRVDPKSTSEDRDFYNKQLRATFKSDDGNSYTVSGENNTIFNGIESLKFCCEKNLSDDKIYDKWIYDVDYPDQIDASNDSVVSLRYSTGGGAAIQYPKGSSEDVFLLNSSNFEKRLVMMAFPFETIMGQSDRNKVMARLLKFFSGIEVCPNTKRGVRNSADIYCPLPNDTTAYWTGNASIISYHGEDANQENYDYPYGITHDVVALHPQSNGQPVGFFQWQVSKGSCDRLKIDTDILPVSEKNVDITFGVWSPRDFDLTFENVTLPFILGEENTGYTFSDDDNQWFVVGIAFRNPLSESAKLEASCTSDFPTSNSYTMDKSIILEGDYKWDGNASIISGMFTPLANDERFAVFKDVTQIHPSSEKPVVFFQWMSSDKCKRLTIDTPELNDSEKKAQKVQLGIKAWNSESYRSSSVTLPYTLNSKGTWNVIQVAFDNPIVDKPVLVKASCPGY